MLTLQDIKVDCQPDVRTQLTIQVTLIRKAAYYTHMCPCRKIHRAGDMAFLLVQIGPSSSTKAPFCFNASWSNYKVPSVIFFEKGADIRIKVVKILLDCLWLLLNVICIIHYASFTFYWWMVAITGHSFCSYLLNSLCVCTCMLMCTHTHTKPWQIFCTCILWTLE